MAALTAAVNAGLSLVEIYRQTGVTPTAVVKYLPDAGAKVPEGEWIDVPGWPEYAVTPEGLIRANEKISSSGRKLRPRLLRPTTHPVYGYQLVYFTRNGETYTKQLGRIVLEAVAGPPETEGLECRHLDGNPLNNNAGNLAWGTHYENMQDMVRHGTRKNSHCKRGHEFSGENVRVRKTGERVCVSCTRAGNRSRSRGEPISQDESDRIYNSLMNGVREDTVKDKALLGLMASGASLSEIRRTLGVDYRTIQRHWPSYKPFEVGGGGDAAEIRETNRQLAEFLRRGKIGKHRDAGFNLKGDV